MSISLNETDREILKKLADNRYTPSLLADEIGMTTTTVQDRLKRLREHDHVDRPGYGIYTITKKGRDRLEEL